MTTVELLAYLRGQGVVLWAEGDQLRYRAPKGVLTADARQALTRQKTEILGLLRQANAVAGGYPLPQKSLSREGELPLSYAQQGVWLTAQTTGHDPFNQPLAFRIRGPLNVAALKYALDEIVRRHEILRTTCAIIDGEPVQRIMPTFKLALSTLDLRDRAVAERESTAVHLATEEAQKPFDILRGPLTRAKLLQTDKNSYVFILTTHTFVVDGYSQGILLHELGQLYEAFLMGTASPLSENRTQYADYAIWQRQMLQEERWAPQLTYWKEQLQDSPPMLQWPVGEYGRMVQTHQGQTKYFLLPEELSNAVRALSRQEGVTVFIVLLAALKALLHRLTGQGDLIVGTTVSNRTRSEFEGLIGYFANHLLLRSRLYDYLSFHELLLQCHQVTADALAYQDFPFERLLEVLSIDPEVPSVPPLQVVFVLHNHAAEEDLQLPGLTIEKYPLQRGTAMRDIHLHISDATGPLSGSLEYSAALFDGNTIDRILKHYRILLECAVSDPGQRLEALPFLRKPERDELILAWKNALPVSEIGKNRHASKNAGQDHLLSEMVPQTELERMIASVWQEVLNPEFVDIHSNFFDLGGRSIHIIQVHGRLKALLKRDIPIIDLFRYPTIHLLSQRLGREQGEPSLLQRSHNRADLLQSARKRRMRARAKQ
jgi:aspartate racemase